MVAICFNFQRFVLLVVPFNDGENGEKGKKGEKEKLNHKKEKAYHGNKTRE